VITDTVEIDHNHQSPEDGNPIHGDGVGVDLEDGVANSTFINCNIHDNADAAFLFSHSSGHPNSGTMMVGNTIQNNGLKSPAAASAFVHNLLDSEGDQAVFLNKPVQRAAAGQKLFALGGPPGQLTDIPPAHWLYGSDIVDTEGQP